MTPIYWVIGFTAILVLYWLVAKSNGKHVRTRHSTEVARENDHLRHVIAELSMEKHFPSERRSRR
jgi:hypothetical protein